MLKVYVSINLCRRKNLGLQLAAFDSELKEMAGH